MLANRISHPTTTKYLGRIIPNFSGNDLGNPNSKIGYITSLTDTEAQAQRSTERWVHLTEQWSQDAIATWKKTVDLFVQCCAVTLRWTANKQKQSAMTITTS
jgi:hypothetical protein